MLKIKKEYIVNSNNKKKAVLIDIETFEKLEELLENYGLGKYMEEITDEEELSINEAKEYYDILKYYNWSF
jgi:PHD/YefM family antitoxin component YafN of YafNO toxin-antitoxin module